MKKVYELKIDLDDELSGIDSISIVEDPAIEINFLYFNKEKETEKLNKNNFEVDNEEKRIIISPALIPNIQIYRLDKFGREYYVYFSEDTISKISEKYMKNGYNVANDTDHSGKKLKDIYVTELWIKESDMDKSSMFEQFKYLPVGTLFVKMKINSDDVWNRIKEGELRGVSVSGYFIEEAVKFQREQEFLAELEKLLEEFKEK